MLGDGHCDPSCNTQSCQWDYLDCGCAPGCSYSELVLCKPECLVPDCNYGALPGFAPCESDIDRTTQKYYHVLTYFNAAIFPMGYFDSTSRCSALSNCSQDLWLLSFTSCLPSTFCNIEECLFNFGLCENSTLCEAQGTNLGTSACLQCRSPYVNSGGECGLECQEGLIRHPIVPDLCVLQPDFTSGENPEVIYVDAEMQITGDGSLARPYLTLSEALKHTKKHYTKVLLIGPSHSLKVTQNSLIMAATNNLPMRVFSDQQIRVTIASHACEQDFAHCERSTLWIHSTPLPRFFSPNVRDCFEGCSESQDAYLLEFVNVNFKSELTATYCEQNCWLLYSEQSSLRLTNVTFESVIGYYYLIAQQSGLWLNFTNVDFINVSAITEIINISDYAKKAIKFVYETGTVTLQSSPFGFCFVGYYPSIAISNVTFQLLDDNNNRLSFLDLLNARQVLVTNCSFQHSSMAMGSMIIITWQNYAFNREFEVVTEDAEFVHYRVENCSFRNNSFTSGKDIDIRLVSVFQNVRVSGCTFEDEAVGSASLVSLISSKQIETRDLNGPSFYVISADGSSQRIDYPHTYAHFDHLLFARIATSGGRLLRITSIPYLIVSSLRVTALAPQSGDVLAAVLLETSSSITLDNCIFESLHTTTETRMLQVVNIVGDVQAHALQFRDCVSASPLWDVASLATRLSATSLQVSRCTNTSPSSLGILSLSTDSVSITSAQLVNNTAAGGGTFFFSKVTRITLRDVTCRGNNASFSHGGVAFVLAGDVLGTALWISRSIFERNTALGKGGVVYVEAYSLGSSLTVLIEDVTFRENQSGSGAALYISSGITLSASQLHACVFASHSTHDEGVLSLHHRTGDLLVSQSSFLHNSAEREAAIYAAFPGDTAGSLSLSNLTFTANSGTAIVGVAFSACSAHFSAEEVRFEGNTGVCLFFENSLVRLTSLEFVLNSASSAPCVQLKRSSAAQITASSFLLNTASGTAGAVLVSSWSALRCDLCDFRNNTAMTGGAVRVEQGSEITLIACVFLDNEVMQEGSALYMLMTGANSLAQECRFERNSGKGDGSIVLFSSALRMVECSIAENHSKSVSPGVVINLSTFQALNCSFRDQSGSAGVFLYISTSCVVHLNNSTFFRGSSLGSGAIYIEESSISITNSSFLALTAHYGSTLHGFGNTVVTITDSVVEMQSNANGGALNFLLCVCEVLGSRFLDYNNSAVAAEGTSLTVDRTSFERGRALTGAGIMCTSCDSLSVTHSRFVDLQATSGAGVYISGQGEVSRTLTVSSSSFIRNKAGDGGAAYVRDAVFLLTESYLLNNSASGVTAGRGGALLLLCGSGLANCSFSLLRNRFMGNSAELKGGAVCWEAKEPIGRTNVFEGNQAQYGPDFSSFAVSLDSDNTSLSSAPSGQIFPGRLVFTILDHYGQVVSIDNSTKAGLGVLDNSTKVYGSTEVAADRGRFVFEGFTVAAAPGSHTKVNVNVAGLLTGLTLNVSMRNCVMGESQVDDRCLLCEPGKFSFSPSEPCYDCPQDAFCLGNFTVTPRPGYWRSSALSKLFLPCPNRDACLGGPSLTGSCLDGYRGNMCQTCQQGYGRVSKVWCSPCPSTTSMVLKLTGFAVGVALLCAVIVTSSMRAAFKVKSLHTIYLKIFMNYLQLVMLMESFNLSWPTLTKRLLSIQSAAGGFPEQLFSVNCVKTHYDESDEFYSQLVVMTLVPAIFMLLSSGIWTVVAAFRRSRDMLKNELVASAIILLLLIHPSVIRVMFRVFNCEEINPGEYWVASLELRCWQGEHWKYALGVALPSLIVWGVGIPSLILLALVVQHKQCKETFYRIRYGYLFNGYAESKYYWEFVVIYRKLTIVAISVFFSRLSQSSQALLALAVLLVSAIVQKRHLPYMQLPINAMEYRSLLVSIVTLFSGLFYLDEPAERGFAYFFFALIVAANVYFLQLWLRRMLSLCLVQLVKRITFLKNRFWVVDETTITSMRNYTRTHATLSHSLQLPTLTKQLYLNKAANQCEVANARE